MADIFDMRSPRIKISQGDRLLEVFIANCPCCGRKHIILRCNGLIDFPLEDAERFAEDIKKVIMVAKTLP